MTDQVVEAPPGAPGAPGTPVDEAAERLLRVLPAIMKRVMGEARMQAPGAFQLGDAQFRIIHALDHRDYTVGELAERMGVRAPTVSRIVDALVARGYVDRLPDPGDRRKVGLRLTPAGRALARETERCFHRAVARFLHPLTGRDLTSVVAACDILENLLVNDRTQAGRRNCTREDLE